MSKIKNIIKNLCNIILLSGLMCLLPFLSELAITNSPEAGIGILIYVVTVVVELGAFWFIVPNVAGTVKSLLQFRDKKFRYTCFLEYCTELLVAKEIKFTRQKRILEYEIIKLKHKICKEEYGKKE